MPRNTRREFAEMCGVTPVYVNQYVARKKIILNESGEIDTAFPMNAAFYEARKGSLPQQQEVKIEVVQQLKERVKAKKPPKTIYVPEVPKKLKAGKHNMSSDEIEKMTTNFEMDNALKRLEMEKKELEVEKLKIQNAKLNGEVIPTELVKMIFAQHFKSVTTAFHQGADNFITEITKRLDLKREEMVKLRKELVEIINQAVNDSIEDSKGSIDNIQEEYSEKRGIGERK